MVKVLVVDDDIASLGTLCTMLRSFGNTVDTAPSAKSAIQRLSMTSYDVIFLDYNMPEHNGVWFMRNAALPPDSTVILVTGFADAIALSDFRRLGVEVVIRKPFTLVAIRGCLKGVLDAA